MPGDEEGNETPEQLRTYFTLNDNLKPVGVRWLNNYAQNYSDDRDDDADVDQKQYDG